MKAKGISGMHKQTRKAIGAFASGRRHSEFNLVFEDFMRSLGGFVAEDAGNPYMRQEPQRDPGGHRQA